MGHNVAELWKSQIVSGSRRLDKLVVEVEGAHLWTDNYGQRAGNSYRVGQLPEVHLEQGGDRVDVLEDEPVLVQVGQSVLVKGHSEALDVGRDAWKRVCEKMLSRNVFYEPESL